MGLFSPLMKRKREKNQFFSYFWRMLVTLEEKILEIHELSQLSINWILKKLKSIQTLVKDIPEIKLSHWYLLSKTYIVTFKNLSRVNCRCSHFLSCYQILCFSFSWLSIIQILFWNLLTDFQHKTISRIFVQLSKKPPYFCTLKVPNFYLNKIASI